MHRLLPIFLVSLGLFAPMPLVAGFATAYQDDTHFYVENDVLKIAVLRTTGNLDGIIHKQSGVNLQSRTENYFPATWSISLNIAPGLNIYVNSGQAISFSGAISTTTAGASLTLTWKGFQYLPNGLPNIPDATITAQISVRTDSQLSYWTIQATGLGTNSVSSINFPNINGIGPLGQTGTDDVLLTSEFKGTLYHNPTTNVPAGIYPGGFYPSAAALMQFLAYFDPNSGFYFASDDTLGYTKDLYWSKSSSPAGDYSINIEHFPPGNTTDTFTLPYNVILGATEGDWFAPAEMYRNWAVRQSWTQQSRTKQVPTWLHDLPIIRNTCAHGCEGQPDQTYANALQEWQQSQQALGVTALGELWGWEQFGQLDLWRLLSSPGRLAQLRLNDSHSARQPHLCPSQCALSGHGHQLVQVGNHGLIRYARSVREHADTTGRGSAQKRYLGFDGCFHRPVAAVRCGRLRNTRPAWSGFDPVR